MASRTITSIPCDTDYALRSAIELLNEKGLKKEAVELHAIRQALQLASTNVNFTEVSKLTISMKRA